jgi:hypothetical protein
MAYNSQRGKLPVLSRNDEATLSIIKQIQSSSTNSFKKSVSGVFTSSKDTSTLSKIESSARLALFNARRVQFFLNILLNQLQTFNLQRASITTLISDTKDKVVKRLKSGFSLSNLIKGFILAIPFLLSDEIKENLKEYFEGLLRGFGVTEEAIKKISFIFENLDKIILAYLGLKILGPAIKTIRLLILLGKLVAAAIRYLLLPGLNIPPPAPPEPGRQPNRPGGTAPTTPVPPAPSTARPVPVDPTATRLPPPSPQPRLPGPAPSVPPLQAPNRTTPRAVSPAEVIEDARIIREIPAEKPPASSLSKLGEVFSKIGRVIPIVNLGLGAYDLYIAYELYKEGKNTEAGISAVTGLGTIMLGIGQILSLPVLGLIGGLTTVLGLISYGINQAYNSIKDYLRDKNNSYNFSDMPNFEYHYTPENTSPEEMSLMKDLSQDVSIAKNTRRRDTAIAIFTKPIIVRA